MVEYADRDFYENTFHGEIIPEKAFPSMILKASIFVKFLTFSRVDDMTEIPEEVSLATCAIADVMYQDGMRKDDAGREIASENNDGYSVSFVTSQSKTTGTVEQHILILHIRDSCTGGVDHMMTNADLTIYNNRGVDKKTARKLYLKTQIKGVSFYTKQQTTVTDQGLSSADMYQIRIPLSADTEGKEYIDADKYRELSAEEAEKYWTINNGDLFGKGLLEDFEKESEFLKQQHTGKVLSFSDNRRGSLPHWRIGGA